MENKKIVYDRVDVNIAIGSTSFATTKKLREGVCIGVKYIDFSSATNRANAINIGVNDTLGSELVGATDFRDYAHGGGNYIDGSFKPTKFSTRSEAKITVVSTAAIAGTNFDGQLIFAVLIDDC